MSQRQPIANDSIEARARLRELAVEEEREEAQHEPPAPLALWRNLVEGRWKLVDRFQTDGCLYYVACESPPGRWPPPALNRKERCLAALVGSGLSEKAAGYALGVGPSALSALLRGTLVKLGMQSRMELIMVTHAIGLSHEELTAEQQLSAARQPPQVLLCREISERSDDAGHAETQGQKDDDEYAPLAGSTHLRCRNWTHRPEQRARRRGDLIGALAAGEAEAPRSNRTDEAMHFPHALLEPSAHVGRHVLGPAVRVTVDEDAARDEDLRGG
jgi:DNA-binding CsgD family transcriptional regulator